MKIGPANAACGDLDQQVGAGGRWQRPLHRMQRIARSIELHRSHGRNRIHAREINMRGTSLAKNLLSLPTCPLKHAAATVVDEPKQRTIKR
jgi:hypothetical protein